MITIFVECMIGDSVPNSFMLILSGREYHQTTVLLMLA